MRDKNVIAMADNAVPEEIFHAAGMATVRLTDAIAEGWSGPNYFPSQSCLFCKSAEGLMHHLPHGFYGVAFASSCTAMEKLYEVFLRKSGLPFIEMLDLPKTTNSGSAGFFRQRLKELAIKMQERYGLRVELDALSEAIRLNNKLRKSLREKKKCRSFLFKNMPLSLGNLQKNIEYVEDFRERHDCNFPRILVFGARIQEAMISRAVEEEQGSVVLFLTDDGLRYNTLTVEEDTNDPFEALAQGYAGAAKNRRTIAGLPEVKQLKEMIKTERIDGILSLSYPFCSKTGYDIAWLRKNREELGVPLLNLELDRVGSVSAGLRNRIGAFIEMLDANAGRRG